MPPTPEPIERLAAALAPLPTLDGGAVLVLATSGEPPAVAVLSTGDVALLNGELWIAVHRGSSAVERLGGACTVLVPAGDEALRVEVAPATSSRAAHLAVIRGPIVEIRPTAEPPWAVHMAFHAAPVASAEPFVSFWSEVRAWLQAGAPGDGPAPPR